MATYEFTYKVPDQVYVDSWAEGKTATAKVKLDNPVITAFVDTFEPSMRIVGSTLEDGIDSEGDWRMKYSSSSTPVQHSVLGVGPVNYVTNHECRTVSTYVQCKVM